MLTEKRIRGLLTELAERMTQERSNYIETTVHIRPFKNTLLDEGLISSRIRITIEDV